MAYHTSYDRFEKKRMDHRRGASSERGGRGGDERGGFDKKLKGKRPKTRLNIRNKSRYKFPKGEKIEYKNLNLLQKYLTDRGKILSRRVTGVSSADQRKLSSAIKRARFLALLPSGSASRK